MLLSTCSTADTYIVYVYNCPYGDTIRRRRYDGSEYKIPNDASTLLQFSYERLCRMTMADKCQDCQRLDCTLFTATPAAKSCYGQTWTDKPDGSGFHNKTAAVANVGREAIFE